MLRGVTPKNEVQRLSLVEAISGTNDLAKITWRQAALEANTFSHPFLVLAQGWLAILFFSWGLFAPRNAIVIAAMFLCAASLAFTIMLTEDMDNPLRGLITVSAGPLQDALVRMNAP